MDSQSRNRPNSGESSQPNLASDESTEGVAPKGFTSCVIVKSPIAMYGKQVNYYSTPSPRAPYNRYERRRRQQQQHQASRDTRETREPKQGQMAGSVTVPVPALPALPASIIDMQTRETTTTTTTTAAAQIDQQVARDQNLPAHRSGRQPIGLHPDVSRTKLAELLDTHLTTVTSYLIGRTQVPLDRALIMAQQFGIEVEELQKELADQQEWFKARKADKVTEKAAQQARAKRRAR